MNDEISENVKKPQFRGSKELFLFYSMYRNAVRSDAGEDRTVPHTVPLRGGALQRHASADCF
jgi:hypothetical protein